MGFTTIYDYTFKGKDVSIFDVEHGFTMYIKHPCGEVIEIFEGIDSIDGAKLIGESFIDSLPVAHEPHCEDEYCLAIANILQ